jgi:holliday junction DNA helicase RuvA
MIAFLTGKPEIVADELLVHTTGGVGYGVHVGNKLLARCANQETVTLYVYTYVKEDRLELYGFSSPEEKKLFVTVLDVSGVGPKTAVTLIDAGAEKLIASVQQADLGFFTAIPRVGKKLAQKIIIELTSKLGSLKQLELGPVSAQAQDVIAALTNLGFSQEIAENAAHHVPVDELPLSAAIKTAVKYASQTNS